MTKKQKKTLRRIVSSTVLFAGGPLSPHFSGEMGTPAGQAGPPGRCAPRPVSAL